MFFLYLMKTLTLICFFRHRRIRLSVSGFIHDNVIDIYIDSKYVHALSAEDGCVLRKKFTKKVKLKKHVLVKSVVDGNEITVPGFCNLDNEIYVMAFYYDGAENYLLLLNDV